MSTPAALALSDAGGAPPPAAAPAPAPNAPGAPPPANAAPAANQPFYTGWTNPDQKDVLDWAKNKNFADPYALAKSARELETTLGPLRAAANLKGYPSATVAKDGTVTPPNPAAVAAWNAANGVPATPDKYEIPELPNNPYPEYGTGVKEIAHRLGMPPALLKAFATEHEALVQKVEAQAREQEDSQSKAALLTLQSEWGTKYQENMGLAQRARNMLLKDVSGLTPEKERSIEAMLGTSTWLSLLSKIGSGNTEHSFAGGDGAPGAFAGAHAQAQAEYSQIQADRASGKISNLAWSDLSRKGGKIEELINRIAAGAAPTN